jgi:hypothetical protein
MGRKLGQGVDVVPQGRIARREEVEAGNLPKGTVRHREKGQARW